MAPIVIATASVAIIGLLIGFLIAAAVILFFVL